jgi:hypothetical protein
VKHLVAEDALVLGAAGFQFFVENDQAFADERGGVRGIACRIAQIGTVRDLNRASRKPVSPHVSHIERNLCVSSGEKQD